MPSKMSQESLIEELEALGYDVTSTRPDFRQQRGISLRAVAPNEFEISIQAGIGLYSTPRHKAVEYESVEVAVFDPGGEFVCSPEIYTSDQVAGWVNHDQMRSIMESVKSWTPNPPFIKSKIGRPHLKW